MKISEGVFVIQKILKTPGGLIRVTAVNQEGNLSDVHVSGDFFFFPADRLMNLEKFLQGVPVDSMAITQTVEKFYRLYDKESPGVVPADFGKALTI